jgi:HSP20 family protein
MPLRVDPLQDLLGLQERMNRLFEESLKGRLELEAAGRGFEPPADVYETAEGFVMLVELPGVEQEDVEIQAEADRLTVRGERRVGAARPESYHRMERTYGTFSRSFPFPSEVDPESVSAQFKDGLLRLEVAKLRA